MGKESMAVSVKVKKGFRFCYNDLQRPNCLWISCRYRKFINPVPPPLDLIFCQKPFGDKGSVCRCYPESLVELCAS